MSLITQCSAPVKGTRCSNPSLDEDKMQCEEHYPRAIKLYIKYKKLCAIAESFDMEGVKETKSLQEEILYVNDCYVSYMRAYSARMKHRNYAIVPECQDYGHNLQFVLLKEKMVKCEHKLEELYYMITSVQVVDSFDISEIENTEVKEKEDIPPFIEKVNTFKEKRLQDEKDTTRAIADYIKQNKTILKQKNKYINIIYNKLLSFIPPGSKYIYHTMMCMNIIILGEIYKFNDRRAKKLYPYNSVKNVQVYKLTGHFKIFTPQINTYTCVKDILKEGFLPNLITLKDFLQSLDKSNSDILSKIGEAWRDPPPLSAKTFFTYTLKGYNFYFEIRDEES
jgi:hypothetical protein